MFLFGLYVGSDTKSIVIDFLITFCKCFFVNELINFKVYFYSIYLRSIDLTSFLYLIMKMNGTIFDQYQRLCSFFTFAQICFFSL